MKILSLIFLIYFFFIFQNILISKKISIIYTVDNIPITSIEIKNEISYLKLINKNLNKMEDKGFSCICLKINFKRKNKRIRGFKIF